MENAWRWAANASQIYVRSGASAGAARSRADQMTVGKINAADQGKIWSRAARIDYVYIKQIGAIEL